MRATSLRLVVQEAMMRPMSLGLVVLVALLLGAAQGPLYAGSSAATPAAPLVFGDLDCGGSLGIGDAQKLARSLIGLAVTQGEGCPRLGESVSIGGVERLWGDVDCGGSLGIGDAQKLARSLIGLQVTQGAGCPAIGAPVEVGPPAPLSPQALAVRLYAATDNEARYQALLRVMGMLRIGVYTAEGGEVQQGAERGPGDFYLYDFELRMMAASLGRGDNSWGVQQIADTLDQVGFREDGQPFTGDDLNGILHDATNDSLATPGEASSLLPLLVRELGLRHEPPYDLANDLAVNEAQFDALQMTLILAGLTLQVIAGEGPLETPASSLIANSNGILKAQAVGVTDFCSDFKAEGSELWGPTKYFVTVVGTIGAVARRAVAFIDIIHGEQLAYSVQVKALEDDSEGSTHYDHGSEDPGRALRFRIEVRMLDDLGETLVKCGWLATADYPPQGPIPGVRVQFNTFASGLEQHGTLDCTGTFCSRMTDVNGIATLTFDPKSETAPYGQGLEVESTGSLEAIAWYQSRFRNLFGTLAQFVTPKTDLFAWSVRYHGCAGGAALAAGAVGGATSGATTGVQLPCAYEGTASATTVYRTSGGDLTWTATASDLRFELKPPPPNGPARYELVRGNLTVQASGTTTAFYLDRPCTLSGGFSIPEPIDDGVHEFNGYIIVDVQKSEYTAGGGAGDNEGHINPCSPRQLDGQYGLLWLSTTAAPGEPGRSLTPGGALEGSNDSIDDFYHISVHSQWSLHPGECNPSPEPVCQ